MKIHEQTIFNAIGILTANFTAATTDICTSNAHGLSDNDMVVLTTTNTLPAGLALATVYYVKEATTNTFQLSTEQGGMSTVDITDTGTGTHTFTMHDIGHNIQCEDFRNGVITFNSANSANMTVKFQGGISETVPDFSAAQSTTNRWDYVQIIDLEDGASIDGDTGVVLSGTDDQRLFEVNMNHLKWFNAIISGWAAGDVTVKIKLGDNK